MPLHSSKRSFDTFPTIGTSECCTTLHASLSVACGKYVLYTLTLGRKRTNPKDRMAFCMSILTDFLLQSLFFTHFVTNGHANSYPTPLTANLIAFLTSQV